MTSQTGMIVLAGLVVMFGGFSEPVEAQTEQPKPPLGKLEGPTQSKAPSTVQWEYKAVDFKEKSASDITAMVNTMASEGWTYVGALGGQKVLFRRSGTLTSNRTVKSEQKLEGTWVVTSAIYMDKKYDAMRGATFVFDDKKLTITTSETAEELEYKVDPKTVPGKIELIGLKTSVGVYQLQQDKLQIAISSDPKNAPTTIADTTGLVLSLSRKVESKKPESKK
ncbi:MAG: TIGR03067 domain-containing protein [Gemmataceae bacterium]